MKKTKVLHYVSIMNRGGQETFIMNVFRNIDRSKVMFDFLCMSRETGDFDEEIKSLGGTIHYADFDRKTNKLKVLDNAVVLYHFLKAHKNEYEAFHIHTQHAMDAFLDAYAAKRAGIKKVIVHSHNTSTLYHVKAHHIFKKVLQLLRIHRFACSKAAGRWMYCDDYFKVINNAIDISKFSYNEEKRASFRKKLGLEDKIIIGHAGRFNEQKNHTYLVKIFAELHKKLPQTHLVLAGQGELQQKIEEMVKEYQLEDAVTFLGIRNDMDVVYQGIDVFLFPSLFEGLPVVLVEAQASGVPCFISDAITDEIMITPNIFMLSLEMTPAMWADRIVQYIEEGHQRTQVDDDIRQAGYDIKELAKRLERFYCK